MPVKMGEKKKPASLAVSRSMCGGHDTMGHKDARKYTDVHRHMQFDALLSFHTQLFYLTLNTIGTVIMNRFIYKTPSTQD